MLFFLKDISKLVLSIANSLKALTKMWVFLLKDICNIIT